MLRSGLIGCYCKQIIFNASHVLDCPAVGISHLDAMAELLGAYSFKAPPNRATSRTGRACGLMKW